MNDRTFIDTNVLVYALGKHDPRTSLAEQLLLGRCIISVQVLNEFVAVLAGKLQKPWAEVLKALDVIRDFCPDPVPLTIATHEKALLIVARYRYHIFDALLIAAALKGSCTTLYSEDMHDGQVIEGLTIRNPFRTALT
jgi:predicted nucleic acid-binding protein